MEMPAERREGWDNSIGEVLSGLNKGWFRVNFHNKLQKMFESESLKYKGDVSPEPKLGVSTVGEKPDS